MEEGIKNRNSGGGFDFQNAFVGREKELNRLKELFEKAQEGSGKYILIRGEAGIGKNRLVRRFVEEAISKGSIYLFEKFTEQDAFNPYARFIKIADKLERSGVERDSSFTKSLNKKKVTENHVSEFLYDIQNERSVLQQKIIAALSSASRQSPIIIEFTDVHLAPLTSWQFIHYLAHNILDQKILVILTLRQDGRETKAKEVPVYADVLQRMNREGFLEIVQLSRFTKSDIRHLLNALFPRSDFSSSFIPMLHEISGGLPDQLSKILELMVPNGDIYIQNNIWFDKEKINKEHLIFLVSSENETGQAIKQLRGLSQIQKEICKYAALIDSCFDAEILSKIIDIPRVRLIKELNTLKERKILAEDDDGSYKFKRPILRSVIIEQIDAREKKEKQGKIIETIEKLGSYNQKAIFQLAYFSNQMDNPKRSFKYLCDAGDYAISKLAFIEAQNFYNNAVQKIPSVLDKGNGVSIISSLMKAAWLDRVLGNWADSLNKCNMAMQLCSPDDINLRNQILIQQGLTYFRLSDWKNSSDCFYAALLNTQTISLYDQAMATYGLGNIFFEISQYEESKNYYHQALKIAEELDSHFLRANIYNNLGAIESILGNRLKAIAMYSQGIPLFKEIGDNYGLARLYNNIGLTYAEEESWSKANESYGKSLSISDVHGLAPMKSITFLNRALAFVYLGDFEEAKEYNFKAHRLLTQLNDELGLAEYYKIGGIIDREQGNLVDAGGNLQKALEKFGTLENQLGCAESQYELGKLALAKSKLDEMIVWYEKAIKSYQGLGIKNKVKMIEDLLEGFQAAQTMSRELA